MPITLNCPKCRKPFRVRDESVGMRVKCPTCGAVLQVPASLSSASLDAPKMDDSSRSTGTPTMKKSVAPARPPKTGSESLLDELPRPGLSSGPPSLPISTTQKMRGHDDDEESDRGRRAATTGPLPPIPSTRRPGQNKTKPSAKMPTRPDEDAEQIIEDAEGWMKVRGGLRWVQVGLIFALLFPMYQFGIAAYTFYEYSKTPDKIDSAPPGLLEVKGINLFEELTIWTNVGSGVLLVFFASIGLLKCLRIPEEARTRGVVSGTIVLLFICFAGFAIESLPLLGRLLEIPKVPAEATALAKHYLVYAALLTITWFVAFLGQSAAALRTSKVLTDTAFSALLVVVVVIGVKIANDYFPLSMDSPKLTDDLRVQTYVIDKGVFAIISVLIASRLMSIASIVRRAVNNWLEDTQEARGVATE